MIRGWWWLGLAFAAMTVGLLFYSQTGAYAWDEGFHLLTAQLIFRGKTPYLDFFFPQTPLNSFWNAFWMQIFGDTWRTAHAVAAVTTSLAVLLGGAFTLRQTRSALAALVTMVLFGGNAMVVQFGPTGQAYGLCLLLIVGSFCLAVAGAEKRGPWLSFGSGVLSAAAASASLLTAPVGPVIWLWMLFSNQAGNRTGKAMAFIAGCVAGATPVLLLIAKDPQRLLFDIFTFNSRFRGINWDDLWQHDFGVYLSAIDSAQALVLIGCGGAALAFFWKRRGPYLLCGLLAAALGLHVGSAHPTFERYFLLTTPWLAMLIGMAVAEWNPKKRQAPVAIIMLLTFLGLGKSLYDERDSFTWALWDEIAKKVDEVTPRNGTLQADEHIYLITRRIPPEGMEHENAHKKLPLTDAELKHLHIISKPQIEAQIRSGYYNTIATCGDGKPIDEKIIEPLYRDKWELEQCTVYWNFSK